MPAATTVTSTMHGEVEIFTLRTAQDVAAEIIPAWGHTCWRFTAQQPVIEPIPLETMQQRPTSYGVPILFPFANRIRDGVFTFRGRQYTVTPPRHGYVRDKAWEVLGTGTAEGAWITARFDANRYPEQILQQFPFPFCLDVTYRLRDHTLAFEATLRNTGTQEMPCGLGIHPYFRRPAQGTLQVPARQRWALQDELPTGQLLDVAGAYDLRQPHDVNSLSLDDIFTDLHADADGLVRCILADREHGQQLTVAFTAAQFPHVVVYTPPAPRQAICIEPYTCPTDGFNLAAQGLPQSVVILQPGETQHYTIAMTVQPLASGIR